MGRTAGRTPEDTRRLLIAAAAEVIRARGAGATLDDIAAHAGVSKGGLVYHYASKDELLRALAQSRLDEFRGWIDAELDPDDEAPGRYTRAYIRALLAPEQDQAAARESIALIAQLMTIPAVAEIARADALRLDADLRADGLPPEVLRLVVAAADGANMAPFWGGDLGGEDELRQLERRLIRLTREPALWQNLPWDRD